MPSRDDDSPHDEYALGALVHLKILADQHLNPHESFQLGSTVNSKLGLYPHLHDMASAHHSNNWQDLDEWVEERLDRLRGGSFPEHQIAWNMFTRASPYSPVRLAHEQGWEPTPNGLSSHCDPSMFGWADAFEDLLAVSSARPMMGFERRQAMNKVLEPMRAIDVGWWFQNRIRWQGLNEVYFPVYCPAKHCSPRSMEEWAELRKRQTLPCDDWEGAIHALGTDLYAYGGPPLMQFLEFAIAGEPPKRGQLDPMGQGAKNQNPKGFKKPLGGGDGTQPNTQPQTEEELYLANKPPGEKTRNPLSILLGLPSKIKQQNQPPDQDQAIPGSTIAFTETEMITKTAKGLQPDMVQTKTTTHDWGSETAQSIIRYMPDVQKRGAALEVQRRDKHGNLISQEMYVSIMAPDHAPFSSPFWRKFWDNVKQGGGRNGLD